jgi:hypothetical protein
MFSCHFGVTSGEVTLVFDKQNTTRDAANATNQTQTVKKVLQHTCAEYDIISLQTDSTGPAAV